MQKSLACFFVMFFFCAHAQVPSLLKDINNALVNGKPRGMTTVGNTVFFSADDGLHGRELWKTTGTEASTVMVADIHPTGSSNPSNFCNVNGVVFFTATSPFNGIELWKTDGTAAGTVMVKDLVEGSESSEPTQLTAFGGKLFFNALRITHNQIGVIVESKLFASNGTAAGTGVFESANSPLINPTNFTIVGNNLFFTASSGTMGKELWKTNGVASPSVVTNILTPGANVGSDPRNLVNVGGILFVSVNNVTHGRQIWKFTPANNTLARLTNMQQLGLPGIEVGEMANLSGTVFFTTHSGNSVLGFQLRKLNSAAADGTFVFANGTNSSNLTAVGNNLFFAQSPALVNAPTLSTVTVNGQNIGTVKSFSLIQNGEYPVPQNLINVNGTLFFTAATSANGRELWKATAAGATFIQDFVAGTASANISDLCARGSDVFFASDGIGSTIGGNELRRSNGTVNGIVTVKNIGRAGSFPKDFVKMGNFTFFTADDGSTGRELWKTDGTSAGTVRVADILVGAAGSNPSNLIVVTTAAGVQTLFFEAKSPNNGRELFKLENTLNAVPTRISDIVVGTGSAGINNMTNVNGTLHFTATQNVFGLGDRIFRVNAARTGVEVTGGAMVFANNLKAMGSTLFFTQSPQVGPRLLNKLVGGVTTQIKTFQPVAGLEDPTPQQLTVVGTRLFFTAADGAISRRVWVTNAAATSVSQVSSHNASVLTNFNGRLVYTAPSGNIAGQRSIFRVNTAFTGVELLASGSDIGGLRAANTNLFFFQAFHQGVVELSKITTVSNVIVSLRSFPEGNTVNAPEMIVAGNNLFFTMTVAASGNELWKSNGTANGTLLVSDIRPGVGNSNVHALAVCGTDLFFSANNLTNGQEPWKLANATALVDDVIEDRNEISEVVEASVSEKPEIKVYPNPAVNFVHVDLPENEMTGTLSILSASGQMVRSIQSSEGETSVQLDIQDLQKGIYMVRWVQSDEQVVVKKLIVQ